MKKTTKHRKSVITLMSLLTGVMCISIGFASWVSTGGDRKSIENNMNADSFAFNDIPVPCFTSLVVNMFDFYYSASPTTYNGFVTPDGEYSLSGGVVSGTFNLVYDDNFKAAAKALNSNNSETSLNLAVKYSLNGPSGAIALSTYGMSVTGITLTATSGTCTISLDKDAYTADNIYIKEFPISDLSTNISFSYTVTLSVSTVSNFNQLYNQVIRSNNSGVKIEIGGSAYNTL